MSWIIFIPFHPDWRRFLGHFFKIQILRMIFPFSSPHSLFAPHKEQPKLHFKLQRCNNPLVPDAFTIVSAKINHFLYKFNEEVDLKLNCGFLVFTPWALMG